jgi:hypothetical protein
LDKFKSYLPKQSLDVLDARTELDTASASLHEKMRALSIKRQNKTSLKQKVKWALYKEKDLKRLIEDVVDLVNDLVELFPAARQAQRQLCEAEASQIGNNNNESLPLLQTVAANQDRDLEAAILEILKSNVSQEPFKDPVSIAYSVTRTSDPNGRTITARLGSK